MPVKSFLVFSILYYTHMSDLMNLSAVGGEKPLQFPVMQQL